MQSASGKTVLTGGAGTISGVGLAPVIVWIFGQYGIEMPPEVAAAAGGILTGLVAFLIAYFVPAKSGKYVAGEGQVIANESDLITDTSDTNGDSDYPDPSQSYYDDCEVTA